MKQVINLQKNNNEKTFKWLHFSDIHVGQAGQNTLWPRASTLLLDDLETAHKKTGGFDCVIFSGDLAQTGSAIEFENFDEVLNKIMKRLGDLGEKPPVVTVPGNHDLTRPGKLDAYGMALSKFWSSTDLQEGLWEKKSEFLRFLKNDTFKNYEKWRENSIKNGIHLKPISNMCQTCIAEKQSIFN